MAVPAQTIVQSNVHIQGDVDLAPGVAIAPGVLLGAAPGCRLIISPGVCLGADVVVQARNGDLVIAPGASLGSGVVVVGYGSIGQHTCIGANSTVINPKVGSSQVVAPGSLVGDPSQSSAAKAPATKADNGTSTIVADPWDDGNDGGAQAPPLGSTFLYRSSANGQNANGQNGSGQQSAQIYGKTQVNRLLETLFPHRQALNGTAQGTTGDAALENRP